MSVTVNGVSECPNGHPLINLQAQCANIKCEYTGYRELPTPLKQSEIELDEITTFARAWIKYISVATLQGENALTRKGVQDAMTGYKNVQQDFAQSLKQLIDTACVEAYKKGQLSGQDRMITVVRNVAGSEVVHKAVKLRKEWDKTAQDHATNQEKSKP